MTLTVISFPGVSSKAISFSSHRHVLPSRNPVSTTSDDNEAQSLPASRAQGAHLSSGDVGYTTPRTDTILTINSTGSAERKTLQYQHSISMREQVSDEGLDGQGSRSSHRPSGTEVIRNDTNLAHAENQHHNPHEQHELLASYHHPSRCSSLILETHICVETERCRRQHFSQPLICKKIVAKARRALSKLGRRPSTSTPRRSNGSFVSSYEDTNILQYSGDATSSAQLCTTGARSELPSGENTAAELPTCHKTPNKSISCAESPISSYQCSSEGCSHTVAPLKLAKDRSSTGSSGVSALSRTPSQSPLSSRYCSFTDSTRATSPSQTPIELEGSSSIYVGEPRPASPLTRFHALHSRRQCGMEQIDTAYAHVIPPPAYSTHQYGATTSVPITDTTFCESPTTTSSSDVQLFKDPFQDGQAVDNWSSFDSVELPVLPNQIDVQGSAALGNNHDLLGLAAPALIYELAADASEQSNPVDFNLSKHCQRTVSLCACHGLPARPNIQLSDLSIVPCACEVYSTWLAAQAKSVLTHRLQDMFEVTVSHATKRICNFRPDIRSIMAPAFEIRPTIDAALVALRALNTNEPLPTINQLTSLVLMALSVLMLKADDPNLTYYTDALYLDVASWPDDITSMSDRKTFEFVLQNLWLPESSSRVSRSRKLSFCPLSNPERYSAHHVPFATLNGLYGLRTGMTARICQCYVDCECQTFHTRSDIIN